jgi:hypothetical protein
MFPQIGYIWLYIFILSFLQQPDGANSSDISNRLFENCNLYFVTSFYKQYGKPLMFPEYFSNLITQQTTAYTPVSLMINVVDYNESGWKSVRNDWIPLNNLQLEGKHSKTRLLFLHTEPGDVIYTLFVNDLTLKINPEFIFVHLLNFSDTSSYKNYLRYRGNSKPIIWNTNKPNALLIPCLTCDDNVVIEESLNSTSIRDIQRIWDSHNSNMNGKIYLVDSPMQILERENSLEGCGTDLKSVENKFYGYCIMHTLGQKHNFTIRNWNWYYGDNSRAVSVIRFYTIVDGTALTTQVINTVNFYKFKFAIVTQFPSSSSSFETYLSPFDLWTWSLIGVSCIFVTLVLGFNRILFMSDTFKFSIVFSDFFAVTVLLLAQVCSNMLEVFRKNRISFLLFGCWLFGCYILMGNLHTWAPTDKKWAFCPLWAAHCPL